MLKRNLESIKTLTNQLYQSTFEIKWNELSLQEKQALIMSYIESIEVIKKNNKLEIRKINLRENITAIEEFSKFDESKESQLVYPIDINMINAAASIQFDEFTQIYKANMYIPKSVFIGILNNVKSTIINILISLQKKYGYENIDNLNLPIESREKEIEEIKRIIYIGDHAKKFDSW